MENVVFIHGLWMVGADMYRLRQRVRQCGFKTFQFNYPSIRKSPVESAEKLKQFIDANGLDQAHIVAHSLGGLVVRHFFSMHPERITGNVITLGTPHCGSIVAEKLTQSRLGRMMLGKSTEQGLLGDVPGWDVKNKLGIIAGIGGIGIGRVIVKYTEVSDGSVMLSETKLTGMSDYLVTDSGHIGLLYNKRVAKQVCLFLREGRFEHAEKGD